MTLSVTTLFSGGATGTTSIGSPGFNSIAGNVYLLAVANSLSNAATPSAVTSNNNITFTLVGQIGPVGPFFTALLYVGYCTASASGGIQVDYAASSDVGYVFDMCTGVTPDTTIVQHSEAISNSATLSSLLTNDGCYIVATNGNSDITLEGGWTTLNAAVASGTYIKTGYISAGDTTPSWTTGTSSMPGTIAVELRTLPSFGTAPVVNSRRRVGIGK